MGVSEDASPAWAADVAPVFCQRRHAVRNHAIHTVPLACYGMVLLCANAVYAKAVDSLVGHSAFDAIQANQNREQQSADQTGRRAARTDQQRPAGCRTVAELPRKVAEQEQQSCTENEH